jgi:hypothetical protein
MQGWFAAWANAPMDTDGVAMFQVLNRGAEWISNAAPLHVILR